MFSPNLRVFLAVAAVVSVAGLAISADALGGQPLGGWKPIKDLKDPHVKEIAEFAVSEYNKQSKATLKLQEVVSGESQVVSGMNYRLVLVVKGGASAGKYEAVVWEKAWEHFMKLTSFKPVSA